MSTTLTLRGYELDHMAATRTTPFMLRLSSKIGMGICAPCVCFESSGRATEPKMTGAPNPVPDPADPCSMIFIMIMSLAFCLVLKTKCSLYLGL